MNLGDVHSLHTTAWKQMEQRHTLVSKDRDVKYTLVKNDEEFQVGTYDKPLPCFGCGIGWFSFLLGFAFPLMWFYATILYFGNYYRKDPRERAGLAASAIAEFATFTKDAASRQGYTPGKVRIHLLGGGDLALSCLANVVKALVCSIVAMITIAAVIL